MIEDLRLLDLINHSLNDKPKTKINMKKMQQGGRAAEKKAAASEMKNKPKSRYGSSVSDGAVSYKKGGSVKSKKK